MTRHLKTVRWGSPLALAIVAGASGCAGSLSPPDHAPAPLRETETNSPLDEGVVPDDRIAFGVRRELGAAPALATETIGVESTDGIVRLSGAVSNLLARNRAIATAHVVRGVRAVVDNVEVTPRARLDFELEALVTSSLEHDPVSAPERIETRSHDEVVTLSGVVDSNAARRAAENDVLAIPGVRGVFDELALRPYAPGPERLQEEALRAMRDDPWLDGTAILVSTGDAVVYLSGWVTSAGQRRRALDDASSTSSQGVDASRLRVDVGTGDGTLRARPDAVYSDGDIGQALLDAYVHDPRVHPFAPTVDVHEGVVILTGVAPNPTAARAADEDAHNVSGMVAVRDCLKDVDSVRAETDDVVRTQVLDNLRRGEHLAGESISVDVVGGRVYLRGRVGTVAELARVVALAMDAPGASDVADSVAVAPDDHGVSGR